MTISMTSNNEGEPNTEVAAAGGAAAAGAAGAGAGMAGAEMGILKQ